MRCSHLKRFLDGVEAKVQLVCQQQFQQLIDAQLKPLLSQVLAAKADPPAAAAPMAAPEKKHDLLQDFANKHARAAQAAMGAPSARGRRGSTVSSDEELYDDLAPEVVEASTERLAPEMLKRVRKYGSVEAWVRFQPKWDARSLREATVLALAADALISERVSQESVGLEILLRRLCALQAVEQYGDWEIADAMSWDADSTSLMPRKAMEGFIKKANARKSLRKKAAPNGKSGGARSNGGGGGRSNSKSNGRFNEANNRPQGGSSNGQARAPRGHGAQAQ